MVSHPEFSSNLHALFIVTNLRELDFGDLDLIFKVSGGLRYMEFLAKFLQTGTDISLGHF